MLRGEEALELQEKLIIIYKFISQEKLMNKFFLSGLKENFSSRNLASNPQVKQLLEMENASEVIKECIMELEDLKPPRFRDDEDIEGFNDKFDYLLNRKNTDYLCRKYGLKDCREIEKLDLHSLLELI